MFTTLKLKFLNKYCKFKILLLLIFFLKINSASYGQNLIRNWSFEEGRYCIKNDTTLYPISQFKPLEIFETVSFPPDTVEYPYCFLRNDMKYYFSGEFTGTPDLYSLCNEFEIGKHYKGIPLNSAGFQFPKNDSCFAGFLAFESDGIGTFYNLREFIGQRLKSELIRDSKYCLSFEISLSDFSQYATSNIGFSFVENACDLKIGNGKYWKHWIDSIQVIDNGNHIINDTINWVKLEFIYNALGNEKDIIIGNFVPDERLTFQKTNFYLPDTGYILGSIAYYYIDNISLTPLTPANAGRDTIICLGDSIQIGMPYWEGLEYEWQAAQGLRITSIANPWVAPTQTTTYNLTLHQCQDTYDAVTIIVQDCKAEPIVNLPTLLKLKDVLSIKNLPANSTILIYNTSGQLVKEFINYQNNQTLTIAEGIYILKLSTDNGFRKVGKLVLVVE